jgi:hypothetical protein
MRQQASTLQDRTAKQKTWENEAKGEKLEGEPMDTGTVTVV